MELISLPDALREMETFEDGMPRRFNIIACSYDVERKTGGKLLVLNNVKLNHLNGVRKFVVPDEFKREQTYELKVARNPHHKENRTKNFQLPNSEIRKAHIHFILFYNGKQIIQ